MTDADFVRKDSEPSDEEVMAQLEMILASKHFCTARSIERFLRYVVVKKLANQGHELKEYTIGMEVFQRGASYDPRTDAVVRVQASMLRKKLAGYYAQEGSTDEVLIELPKGHYVPCFAYRRLQEVPLVDVEANKNLHTVIDREAAPPDQAGGGGRRLWVGRLRLAATFVIGLLTAVALQQWRGQTATRTGVTPPAASTVQAAEKEQIDAALLPLWEKFLEPGASNVLAYGTPQFFNADGVYLRDVQVNSAADIVPGTRLMALQKDLARPLAPIEIYTGVGETHGVYLLSKFFWKASRDLRVARSRMVGWDDAKDCNLIFLSSMRFHTLAKELSFPTDFVISHKVNGDVVNLHPRGGEQTIYAHTSNHGTEYNYAVVTLWPGKTPNRRVLVLSGSSTWSTLATAEYVTEPEHLRRLHHHLAACRDKAGAKKHPPYFQVLLRVEIKDNQPVATSYVTHHDLDIPDAGNEPPAKQMASIFDNR